MSISAVPIQLGEDLGRAAFAKLLFTLPGVPWIWLWFQHGVGAR